MVRCSVLECPNKQGKCSGITFHKFPKDEARRVKWIEAVGRKHWTPSSSSLLCSSHFTEENMDRTSLMYVRLRQDAVPTIFTSLSKHPQKKIRPGHSRKKQLDEQDEHERQQIQPAEGNRGDRQNCESSVNSVCESATCEPEVGSVLLTTIKKENETGEQIPVSVLLEWSEVGTCEPEPVSTTSAPDTDQDNGSEQKPSLADLLEWPDVGSGMPTTGLTLSNVQSVLCTPDPLCEVPLKRKSNTKAKEPKRRKRKAPKKGSEKNKVDVEMYQDEQNEVSTREPTPEALLLECCTEEETCDSEHASSIISSCIIPHEIPVLFTTDTPDVEILKKQLYQSNEQLRVAKKRIRILMQNRRRFQKRITSLKGTCSELKSKNLLNEDKIKFLERTLGGSYRELFERKAGNPSGASLPLNYSSQLREFATKLYFYSRDAYHYMRQTFQNCLPHPGTLRRWNNPYTDCSPDMAGESASDSIVIGDAISVLDVNSACREAAADSGTNLISRLDED